VLEDDPPLVDAAVVVVAAPTVVVVIGTIAEVVVVEVAVVATVSTTHFKFFPDFLHIYLIPLVISSAFAFVHFPPSLAANAEVEKSTVLIANEATAERENTHLLSTTEA
jgi:hypothetical protein